MNKIPWKFQLGQEVKDKITGYDGIVDNITDFLYGCRRYGVRTRNPEIIEDDEAVRYLDEPQLEFVSDGLYEPPIKKEKKTGGNRNFHPTKW